MKAVFLPAPPYPKPRVSRGQPLLPFSLWSRFWELPLFPVAFHPFVPCAPRGSAPCCVFTPYTCLFPVASGPHSRKNRAGKRFGSGKALVEKNARRKRGFIVMLETIGVGTRLNGWSFCSPWHLNYILCCVGERESRERLAFFQ